MSIKHQTFQYALRFDYADRKPQSPNRQKLAVLSHSVGCTRYVYNKALALQEETYQNTGKKLSYEATSKVLTSWKAPGSSTEWLRGAPAVCLQQTLRHLETAYSHFFKYRNLHGRGRPRYKQRGQGSEALHFPFPADLKIDIAQGSMHIPKVGSVGFRVDRTFDPKVQVIRNVVIKREAGLWYVCFCTEQKVRKPKKLAKKAPTVALDMGVKIFAYRSDGLTHQFDPQAIQEMKRLEKLIGVHQASIARKKAVQTQKYKALQKKINQTPSQKGVKLYKSKKVKALELKIQEHHARMSHIRKDMLHKASTALVKHYDRVIVEDLKIQFMTQSSRRQRKAAVRAAASSGNPVGAVLNPFLRQPVSSGSPPRAAAYPVVKVVKAKAVPALLVSKASTISSVSHTPKLAALSTQSTKSLRKTFVPRKSQMNKAILRQGWGMFVGMLAYKLAWKGGELIKVNPAYTSCTCPVCSYKDAGNRTTQAVFKCLKCAHSGNADFIASQNILKRGRCVPTSPGSL